LLASGRRRSRKTALKFVFGTHSDRDIFITVSPSETVPSGLNTAIFEFAEKSDARVLEGQLRKKRQDEVEGNSRPDRRHRGPVWFDVAIINIAHGSRDVTDGNAVV